MCWRAPLRVRRWLGSSNNGTSRLLLGGYRFASRGYCCWRAMAVVRLSTPSLPHPWLLPRFSAPTGKADLVAAVRAMHNVLGGTIDPHASYLLLRGMKVCRGRQGALVAACTCLAGGEGAHSQCSYALLQVAMHRCAAPACQPCQAADAHPQAHACLHPASSSTDAGPARGAPEPHGAGDCAAAGGALQGGGVAPLLVL